MHEENLLEEDSHQRGFHRAGGWGGGGGVSRCAGRGGGSVLKHVQFALFL